MLIYILFIVGFFLLIKGADLLVDGASAFAQKMKIPSIVIGLTIVSFGTSAPEFVVNLFASIQGNSDIAIGNILGSNIANILLILGISSLVYPLTTKSNTVWKEIPFSLLGVIVLGIMANDMLIDGGNPSVLTRTDGLILLCFFIIFLYYTFGISKLPEETDDPEVKALSPLTSSLYIGGGLLGLIVGGKWIVDGAVQIAGLLNISQTIIGLTIVAIGTSLPELATSVIAARKKQLDIAIGNVVGSNIFNIFWILGFSSVLQPLPFTRESNIALIITLLASSLLFLLMFIGKKHIIERWQGGLMVGMYLLYILYLVISN